LEFLSEGFVFVLEGLDFFSEDCLFEVVFIVLTLRFSELFKFFVFVLQTALLDLDLMFQSNALFDKILEFLLSLVDAGLFFGDFVVFRAEFLNLDLKLSVFSEIFFDFLLV
jgi:hypothetical protein